MAIIDMVSWSPQSSNGTIYAWKFPHTNLSTYTQLVVQESQEALLFSKGRLMGKFGPGKHTLDTENLPILRSLFGIPFGGKNPFMAEVWFVNKIVTYNLPWVTEQMSIHDPDYNTQLPLAASGQYGIEIVDPEKFLIRIVGTNTTYGQNELTHQFAGEFNTKVKSLVVQFMLSNRIGYKSISAYLDQMSQALSSNLEAFWGEMGIKLHKFYVTSIDIDTTTPEGRRVKEAIAQQSSMSITGHTWQQEQMFDTANNAIGNLGNGNGGLLGGLMAINMMGGMGAGMGSMMNPQYNQPTFGGNVNMPASNQSASLKPTKTVYCSNCGKKYSSDMRFCPHCGDEYHPCPNCGADNDKEAKRCISCGTRFDKGASSPASSGRYCPKCGADVQPNQAFCGSCGAALQTSDTCSRCGNQLPPNTRFCPVCGQKR